MAPPPAPDRRARGAFFTPPELAELLAREALAGATGPADDMVGTPAILDPACGDGELLLAAWRRCSPRLEESGESRLERLRATLFGLDRDPRAVGVARERLAAAALGPAVGARALARGVAALADNLRVGDAIVSPDEARRAGLDWPDAFDWTRWLTGRRGWDVVVANPPFLNSRRLAREFPAALRRLWRDRFRSARGAFDSYVLFVERIVELLRPGGRCAMVVPNKIGLLGYAAPCRRLLLEETRIEAVHDLSRLRTFDAGVYPYVVVCSRREERGDVSGPTLVRVLEPRRLTEEELLAPPSRLVPVSRLCPEGWRLEDDLAVEELAPTRPLGELATIAVGTPGFSAARLAAALEDRCAGDAGAGGVEVEGAGEWHDFVTSGGIDPWRIRLGTVRFAKRLWRRPCVRRGDERLSTSQRRLFAAPKLIVAGMSRRLEAARDAHGLALGVQVYAVVPRSGLRDAVTPRFLLAMLNSRLLSTLFERRYAAKRLAGGYLAINKGQLARLPIPSVLPEDAERSRWRELVERLAERRESLETRGTHAGDTSRLARASRRVERALERCVERLYGLRR